MNKMREAFELWYETTTESEDDLTYHEWMWRSWQAALSTSPLLDKNDQADGEKLEWEDYEKIRDFREVDFAINNFHLNCTADNATEMVKAIVENTRNYPQPPQPDSNELVELRRDAERLDYLDTLTKRKHSVGKKEWPISSDMHFGASGVSLYVRTGIGSQIETSGVGVTVRSAIDAALAQSPSKKGGE